MTTLKPRVLKGSTSFVSSVVDANVSRPTSARARVRTDAKAAIRQEAKKLAIRPGENALYRIPRKIRFNPHRNHGLPPRRSDANRRTAHLGCLLSGGRADLPLIGESRESGYPENTRCPARSSYIAGES